MALVWIAKAQVFGLIGAVLGAALGLGWGPPAKPFEEKELALPRPLATDEAVQLRVAVGAVPAAAKVVVRSTAGRIIGTVAPFGIRPGQKAGAYSIPVPSRLMAGEKVTLRFEVVEKGAAPRPPTRAELEDARLIPSKVTKP